LAANTDVASVALGAEHCKLEHFHAKRRILSTHQRDIGEANITEQRISVIAAILKRDISLKLDFIFPLARRAAQRARR
jgi:hypothetical protein